MKKKIVFLIAINLALVLLARKMTLMTGYHFAALGCLSGLATMLQFPVLSRKDRTGYFEFPGIVTGIGVFLGWMASLWSHGAVDGDILCLSLCGSMVGFVGGLFLLTLLVPRGQVPKFFT